MHDPDLRGAHAPRVHVVSPRRLFVELFASALPAFRILPLIADPQRSKLVIPGCNRGELVVVDGSQSDHDHAVTMLIMESRALRAEVLVMLSGTDSLSAARWVEAGASAVLTDDASMAELVDTLERLARGETLLGVAVREGLLARLRAQRQVEDERHAPFKALTRREAAVLRQLAVGASPEEIARTSFVSLNTVRTQIRAVLTKIGVNSVVAAVATAYRSGWIATSLQ